MMFRIRVLIAVIVGASSLVFAADQGTSAAPLQLQVRLAPDHSAVSPAIDIELVIENHRGKRLRLAWPETDIASHVRLVRVEGADNVEIKIAQDRGLPATSSLLPAEPNRPVTFRYSFEPAGIDSHLAQHPAVEVDHLHFMGHAVLPRLCFEIKYEPECGDHQPIEATFDWSAYGGDGWTTWSQDTEEPAYRGPLQGMLESIYAIGAFNEQAVTVEAGGQPTLPVTLVTHGLSSAEQRDAEETVRLAMTAVINSWRETPADKFLVTLRKHPVKEDIIYRSGFAANDSFALMTTDGNEIKGHEFLTLVAHEFTHRWLDAELFFSSRGKRLFHEGFTDFVARQVIWRQGLMSFDDYLEEINNVLETYFGSWQHDASSEDLLRLSNETLSYQRGELLAFSWAHRLAHQVDENAHLLTLEAFENFGLPIDRLMRAIVDAADGDGTLLMDHIDQAGKRLGLTSIMDDLKAISRGDGSIKVANWFSPCTELASTTIERPDPGLDLFRVTRTGVISGLSPEGPAAKAGLRDGDAVRHWTFNQNGNSSEMIWQVSRNGDALEFAHSNKAKAVPLPQFHASSHSAENNLCLGKEG